MSLSPFYYHVQDLIVQDDDKAIKKIFEDPAQKEEFKSYYDDFMHCTYPNSFKCLYYLMNEVHLRYDIHSLFTHAINDNNTEWLNFFFETFQENMSVVGEKKINHGAILAKNIFTMSINFDYESFMTASPEMWHVVFKNHKCEIFQPHLLLNTIFESEDLSNVYVLEALCQQYQLDMPLKDIISKAFFAHELNMAEYFISKYSLNFDKDDLTDLINTVGLSGNVDVFKIFTDHLLPFEEFNHEQISFVFNSGLLIGKTQLTQYLKEQYGIDFYPDDTSLRKQFIAVRSTIWEDNDETSSTSAKLLDHVNSLFDLFLWDKNELKKEIYAYPQISQLLSKLHLHNKLQHNLEAKNKPSIKSKI